LQHLHHNVLAAPATKSRRQRALPAVKLPVGGEAFDRLLLVSSGNPRAALPPAGAGSLRR
jgi:hypothetical protein